MKIFLFLIFFILPLKLLANNEGEIVYKQHCFGCHSNGDLDGFGPAIKNSSEELLKNKVLKGRYPNNYTPKRRTNFMPIFPFLKNNINGLAEYLKK